MIKKWFKKQRKKATVTDPCVEPVTILRKQHSISRKQISVNALKVLNRLQKAGFAAYLVGGSVRDLMLDVQPKDFDITTDARPEQMLKLFRNARMIGRRFRIIHVYFHREIIEVATFRANSQDLDAVDEGQEMPTMLRDDNTYGTIEEDAWRRDFTVNALYYSIKDFSVVDFTGGIEDLKNRTLRMIGDPVQRYHEDPVRLLRAIRHAAKHDFKIETETETPIINHPHLLQHVPPARLFDEVLKMFFSGYAQATYHKLSHYGYVATLFPEANSAIDQIKDDRGKRFIELAMQTTDQRFQSGQTLNPGFLFSVILWPALQVKVDAFGEDKRGFYQALHHMFSDVIAAQTKRVMIPRRMSAMIRAIWMLQFHLLRRRPSRVQRLVHHRYFRAAIDFLELRVESGEQHQQMAKWWRQYQQADHKIRQQMLDEISKKA